MNKHDHNTSHNIKSKSGFTIIEVVLVLAIAGLIFLMVFIALPALQRNQRDTQRRNDMTRLASAIESYKANNRGNMPSDDIVLSWSSAADSEFGRSYLKADQGEFSDPSGNIYRIRSQYNVSDGFTPSWSEHAGTIFISRARCEGEAAQQSNQGQYAIQYPLEGGGAVCLEGQGNLQLIN